MLPTHARHDSKFDQDGDQGIRDTYERRGFDNRRQSSPPENEPADANHDVELSPYPYGHDTSSHDASDASRFYGESHFPTQSLGSVNSEERIIRPINSRASLYRPHGGSV